MESFLNNSPKVSVNPSKGDATASFEAFSSHFQKHAGSLEKQVVVSVPIPDEMKSSMGDKAVPQVSLVMEGDKVVQVIVNCSCGQSIALACEY